MNCTQKQQLVCFPKVRVYKPWFRHFNDHKDFRNEGTVHLFSLMALFSYANFRSNERVIYGDRYMEAPGQWIALSAFTLVGSTKSCGFTQLLLVRLCLTRPERCSSSLKSHLSCRLPKEQRMRSCRIPTKSITTPHTSCVSPSRSTPRSQYPRAHAQSVLSSKGGVAFFFTSQVAQECTG